MEKTGYWGCSGHGWRNKSVLRHERAGRISPSCRLYEPGAESRSWGAEKTPLKLRGILTTVLETYQRSARR